MWPPLDADAVQTLLASPHLRPGRLTLENVHLDGSAVAALAHWAGRDELPRAYATASASLEIGTQTSVASAFAPGR